MSPTNELISFLENHPDAQIVMDADYRILAANAAYRRHYAGGRDVVGQTCYAVSHGYSRPCDECGESLPARGQPGERRAAPGTAPCITRHAARNTSMSS